MDKVSKNLRQCLAGDLSSKNKKKVHTNVVPEMLSFKDTYITHIFFKTFLKYLKYRLPGFFESWQRYLLLLLIFSKPLD